MSDVLPYLPDEALLRIRRLTDVVPLSSVTIWRRVKAGQFPKPIKLDEGRITAWRWGEVRAWLDAQGRREAA